MDFANTLPPYAPSAWLDLDALDKNIAKVNQATANIQLRIASKSVRSLDVLRYIKDNKPNYIGIMSYSASESAYLLDHGFDNILCAYPTFDSVSIVKTFPRLKQGATMIWMVDRIEQWQFLDDLAKQHCVILQICLDINMSMPLTFPKIYFGTKRSSLIKISQVSQLLSQTKHLTHTQLTAMMGYEGQIAGLPEHTPHKSYLTYAIRELKKRSMHQVTQRRGDIANWLKTHGYPLSIVNGGGSGSMAFTSEQPEITEITVGSAYYFPALFSYMDSMQDFTPAAGFVLPVIRHPEPNVVTCQGGGFIASGSMGAEKYPQIIYPKGVTILKDEGYGEVQTPLLITSPVLQKTLTIGDYVWCRHAKAGELCEHFNELITYRTQNGKTSVTGRMTTYRGAGQCFH